MKKYKQAYGTLSIKTLVDAVYGSYGNYSYCKENGITLYMKYSGYYKETKKNKFISIHLNRGEKNINLSLKRNRLIKNYIFKKSNTSQSSL